MFSSIRFKYVSSYKLCSESANPSLRSRLVTKSLAYLQVLVNSSSGEQLSLVQSCWSMASLAGAAHHSRVSTCKIASSWTRNILPYNGSISESRFILWRWYKERLSAGPLFWYPVHQDGHAFAKGSWSFMIDPWQKQTKLYVPAVVVPQSSFSPESTLTAVATFSGYEGAHNQCLQLYFLLIQEPSFFVNSDTTSYEQIMRFEKWQLGQFLINTI